MTKQGTHGADHPGRRALALAVAAVVVYVLLDSGRAQFRDVPLLTGLGYLAGAVAGGRAGALWAPALVVTGWGLGNLALYSPTFADLHLPESAAHMLGMGLGVLVLAGLARLGIVASLTGVALSVLLSGALFAAQRGQQIALFNEPSGYAGLLLLYAAAELVTVQVRRR